MTGAGSGNPLVGRRVRQVTDCCSEFVDGVPGDRRGVVCDVSWTSPGCCYVVLVMRVDGTLFHALANDMAVDQ